MEGWGIAFEMMWRDGGGGNLRMKKEKKKYVGYVPMFENVGKKEERGVGICKDIGGGEKSRKKVRGGRPRGRT